MKRCIIFFLALILKRSCRFHRTASTSASSCHWLQGIMQMFVWISHACERRFLRNIITSDMQMIPLRQKVNRNQRSFDDVMEGERKIRLKSTFKNDHGIQSITEGKKMRNQSYTMTDLFWSSKFTVRW